jgi:acetoacetate decarboxylase
MSFIQSKDAVEKYEKAEFTLFGAELAMVYYLTKSEIVERLLPPPLKPYKEPLVLAFVADYPKTSFCLPYKEGAILIAAEYNGTVGYYNPSMLVTNDIAMAGGREIMGYPKKIADIEYKKEETQISGSLTRHGIKFVELSVNLQEDSNEDRGGEILMALGEKPTPYYNYLFLNHPGTAKVMKAYLVELYLGQENFEGFEYGSGKISLNKSTYDPWYEVEVETILGGFWFTQDTIMKRGEIVTEVKPEDFAPYAYNRWDPLPEE